MSLCHGGPPAGPHFTIVRIAIAIGALAAAPGLATAQPPEIIPGNGATTGVPDPGLTAEPGLTADLGLRADPQIAGQPQPATLGDPAGPSTSDRPSKSDGPFGSSGPVAGGGPIRLPQTGRVGTPASPDPTQGPGASQSDGYRPAAGGAAAGNRPLAPTGSVPTGDTGGAAAGEMIAFSHVTPAGTQRITLIHTRKSWITVYDVGPSGSVRLMSSRPIDADFSLELNATSPLPAEIRRMSGASR